MAIVITNNQFYTDIANALRAKTGQNIAPRSSEMADAIHAIELGGSEAFHIAYGDTEPEDTTKLWVKCPKPAAVQVTAAPVVGNEDLEEFVGALPTAACDMGVAAVGTKVYLFGGTGAAGRLDGIHMYDTETGTLTTLDTTLPYILCQMGVAAVGEKIYLFGGTGSGEKRDIHVFDTQTHTLTTLATTLPSTSYRLSAAAVGSKVYLFGGFFSSAIHVFDTLTGTVSTLTVKLPQRCWSMGAAVIGTKIYLFGGETEGNALVSAIRVFDTQTNTLSTHSTALPTAAWGMGTAVIGSRVYLFGGNRGDDPKVSGITVFDTDSGTAAVLSPQLPTAAYGMGVTAIGTAIHLFGGYGTTHLSPIHRFVARLPLAENHLLIEASGTENLFPLLPGVELGVRNVYRGNADGMAEKVEAAVCTEEAYREYYTSSASEVASSTTLTASVDCNVGDLVVAALATRDTLTISDGWTLVSTSNAAGNDTTNQRISWAYKFAENATESITAVQASIQRLYINIVALQGATGIVDNGYIYQSDASNSITVSKPEGLVLWGLSAPLWSEMEAWEASNAIPIIQLGSSTQSRLGVALDQSDSESVTFTAGASTQMIIGSLIVEGMSHFHTEAIGAEYKWQAI